MYNPFRENSFFRLLPSVFTTTSRFPNSDYKWLAPASFSWNIFLFASNFVPKISLSWWSLILAQGALSPLSMKKNHFWETCRLSQKNGDWAQINERFLECCNVAFYSTLKFKRPIHQLFSGTPDTRRRAPTPPPPRRQSLTPDWQGLFRVNAWRRRLLRFFCHLLFPAKGMAP